jgi:hypothetical protein
MTPLFKEKWLFQQQLIEFKKIIFRQKINYL